MEFVLNQTFYAVMAGGVMACLLFFAFTTFWYRDRFYKKSDEYLELANNSNFFSKRKSVMWDSEKQLFQILVKLFGDKYHIFPQMSLATILDIKEDYKDHDNLFREIDHKSVDFVFTDKESMTPVLVIELNGESHWYQINRKNRDRIIQDILKKADIKFISIDKKDNYDEEALRQQIESTFKVV